jgi:hypothetical protein
LVDAVLVDDEALRIVTAFGGTDLEDEGVHDWVPFWKDLSRRRRSTSKRLRPKQDRRVAGTSRPRTRDSAESPTRGDRLG